MATKLKSIFSFFEKNTRYRAPLKYKILHDYNSISKEDLKVKWNLDLWESEVSKLPDNLEIEGSLDLERSGITKLPSNLRVRFNLYLSDTKINSLPSDLKVGGDLYLRNTPLSKKYTKEEIRSMASEIQGNIKI